MKKIILMVVCMILLLENVSVLAYEFPSEFWWINAEYTEALESNNHSKIIDYGNRIINLMKSEPDGLEKRNTLVSRYHQVGLSYAEIGDYDNAAKVFHTLYDYVSQYGDEYYDYIVSSKARALQYTSDIKMYTSGGTSTYYGAVNEHYNGVLFGLCSNGKTRSKLENESMVLTYQELGQSLLSYNVGIVRAAASDGYAVEFALNCPKEGNDIRNIRKMDPYLKEISDLFKKYSTVPVYLRFAAEFDIWTTLAEPEEFVFAFRYVSDYFKARNSNVAIVWSPNQVSNWYVDIDDYYPGDEYVDWVGLSLYAQKYFQGDPNQKEEYELVFRSGVNSDPIIAVKDIVEKYGNKKPIMISESGCGHKIVGSGENTTDFALQRLREFYLYLPMVYPQIKLIAHFDWFVDAETEKNDFRLSSNPVLQNEYLKLVRGQRFIQDSFRNNTDFCYRPIYNGIGIDSVFEVSCYAHLYQADLESVTYYIDNRYMTSSNQIPYTAMIDASGYSGSHRLKAVAKFKSGKTLTTESNVMINNTAKEVTVEINHKQIQFDQDPILYNSRTMVPMRKIFEELGAQISWDALSQTVSGRKGDRNVRVTIGQKKMYVNNMVVELDTAPFILSGRTLVPARAIAEGLGCTVDWDASDYLVSITPKVFRWSEWNEELPDHINSDLYYIEEKDEYRVRTREREYFTLDFQINSANFVEENVSYGSWGEWQNEYISTSDDREVETRTVSSPKQYHYAHYCIGNISDKENRYTTWDRWWHEACDYHDLGWFDSPLPYSEDSTSNYAYYIDGKKYRCPNTCFRWYLMETTGGNYTQYRSRPVYREYVYWEWSEWSGWSRWDDEDPYDYYNWYDSGVDVDERTVYRYKEKG